MSTLPLGTPVTITGQTVKVHHAGGRVGYQDAGLPTMGYYNAPPVSEGVIVGQRTITPGYTSRDPEWGSSFRPDTGASRNVYLVAFHLRRRPVMCAPHQIAPKEET